MAAKPPSTELPWTNCRLVLSEEFAQSSETGFPEEGVVARLYYSTNSHPAVRQSFHSLYKTKVSFPALALHNLVNKRGPDGLVGCIPGETRHSSKLLALCKECFDAEQVLVCSIPLGDVVLVPRIPSSAARDSVFFIAYATNIKAVEMCESLRSKKKVAVVLDVDNTLIDASAVTLNEQEWNSLGWRGTTVTTSTGRPIQGQYAFLPGSDEDPYSDGSWIIHWRYGRVSCTFKVRVRRGWHAFREWLSSQKHRFLPFVCSKGKLEYIQLIWHFLDPRGELIPREDWPTRLTSTFPDTLAKAANKTALTAVGCAAISQPQVPTQLAAPVCLVDDSMEAYERDYDDSLLYVEEYRPSDLIHADQGSVLRQVGERLDSYWTATCTATGTFAWQAAQSFATAILTAMKRNDMESPDALQYLQGRCARQGELLGSQIKLRSVFGISGIYVADDEYLCSSDDNDNGDKASASVSVGSPGEMSTIGSGLSSPNHSSAALTWPSLESQKSLLTALIQQEQQRKNNGEGNSGMLSTMPSIEGGSGGGTGGGDEMSVDDAVTASLMMRC